jgi:hypothetical protein
MMMEVKKYTTFNSFYEYYLTEHSNANNRKVHFIGTLLLIFSFLIGIVTGKLIFFILIPILGYGFAWVGHYFIEKNKPATFTYPFYSLAGDFVMFWDIITGNIDEKLKKIEKNN